MTHRRAVALMVLVTLLWSIAGVMTRHLDAVRSFEVTFWRSLFNALGLAVGLTAMRGTALWRGLLSAPRVVWISGLCWSVMFTAFMVAITLTTVANVLVTMAIGPLISALVTLPLAWPLQASARDLGLLAMLGVVQLAIPCLLVVRLTRELPAPEIALLGLLEVIFGVAWAWLGAGEVPSSNALAGGVVVLGALVVNEALALRQRLQPASS
jgi:drug/metabolite transporter (DMT)-like permease